MKKIFITLCIILCSLLFSYAVSSKEQAIINELGQNYYQLRMELPFYNEDQIFLDEAILNRDKNINILMKLLTDESFITTAKTSFTNYISKSSSNLVANEYRELINTAIKLVIYGGNYQYFDEALGDHFKKLNEKDAKLIMELIQMHNKFYSLEFQKYNNMPKKCADVLAKNFSKISHYSNELNREALSELRNAIDNGCINIKILSFYVNALEEDGKFNNTTVNANKKILTLYETYFNTLSNEELAIPITLEFVQNVTMRYHKAGDYDSEYKVYKTITNLIRDSRINLEKQPQWVRLGYLSTLSKSVELQKSKKVKADDELITNLRAVYKKKGNVFIFKGERVDLSPYSNGKSEKEFLEAIKR